MKRIFILFFAISVFLSLVFSSCTVPNADEDLAPQIPDESEVHSESVFDGEGDDVQKIQENIESEHEKNENDEPELKEANEPEVLSENTTTEYPLNGRGTYEYKGIIFEGYYNGYTDRDGNEYYIFDVDIDIFYTEEMFPLLRNSFSAALALVAGDFEKFMRVLDKDSEDYDSPNKKIHWADDIMHYLDLLILDSADINTHPNMSPHGDLFVIYYKNAFSFINSHVGDMSMFKRIAVYVFLNNEGEWKVYRVSFFQ